MKTIFPKAKPYWSDLDNHCIIKIDDKYYDIGGEVKQQYIEDKSYYRIPTSQTKGYSLLKYTRKKDSVSVRIEKYA